MRRHVTRAPRVAVVAPGPADAARPLQDDEVGDTLAAQPRGGPQPAEPGTDHRDPHMLAFVFAFAHADTSTHHENHASEHWRNGRVGQ
ncbi:hypothetical protein SVIOM74S_04695 [Streptomyces violarus]